ncbi:MAG: GH3 auxin-responsive promoter family protein [Muribaculaceae bacterium]
MIDLTPIARQLFSGRLREAARFVSHGDTVQREELDMLLQQASRTEIGIKYGFGERMTYATFRERVPLHGYEDLRERIMRMVRGEKNVLWRGRVTHFAQSSGTSDGKSKYIPISDESFKRCHYRGGSDVVAHYLNINPESRMFSGKGFILGGSFANELTLQPGVRVGDLSANLIDNINPVVNLMRVPDKHTALMQDWSKKLPALVEASRRQNVTNISGVPSWFLTVLKEVIKREGTACIHDVWPNLEVFFHGGISFEPYRDEYASICDNSRMHYIETYNASEGFFAVQSSAESNAMLLLLDVGVFYEFIPLEDVDSDSPRVLPIWEVERGKTYSLVISANNGLWRYKIGDTVRVEQTSPVKIKIAGRTKHFINAFGEELMVHNADEAIKRACRDTGAMIANYTAAPVYACGDRHGRHEWLIEFNRQPDDITRFAEVLDGHLQAVNSDYEAKRAGGIFLDCLTVVVAQEGLFDRWLRSTGKLGGQRKVPRLSNDRHIIDAMIEMNNQ